MQTKLHPIWVSTLFYVTLALAVAPWAAADSTSGTWKMNPEKSKYSPGPTPKSVTTVIESDAAHFKIDSHTVNADGTERHISFDAKTDGKDYPVTGEENADTVSVKRINARTTETTMKK